MLILTYDAQAVPKSKPKPTDTSELRRAVDLDDIRDHQQELQEIADENNGTRASGTPGFEESVDYVVKQLKKAGYRVTRQQFDFPFFQELSEPLFQQLTPNVVPYTPNDADGFFTMQYSGTGTAVAEIQAVDVIVPIPPGSDPGTSNSGCETADFVNAGFVSGRIALVQRGTCTFQLKAENAQAAGAIGVIIFNEGQPGRTDAVNGTLGGPTVTVPVIGTTYAIGTDLYT